MPVQKTAVRRRKKKKSFTVLKTLLVMLLIVFVFFTATTAVLFYYVMNRELPSIAVLKDYRPSIATRVYADNYELIDEFFLEDRKIVKIADLPPYVMQAFIAAEDARFMEHKGLDLLSIARAFFKNVAAGRIVQGGSTITQQVAKTLYLSPEKSYLRKVKEAILAYKIDKYLSKDEILNLYLNHIYLGHGTYGVEAAAEGYFGKSAKHINVAEAAMLAGLPKAPTNYSPFLHFDRAKQRQVYVLERMAEDGYLKEEEKQAAETFPIMLQSIKPKEKIAPYFIENIRRYIQEKYGSDVLYKEGLEVYTTLNMEMQKAAVVAVERGLQEVEARTKHPKGLVQGALLCMEAKTGAIKAMVGGRDFRKSEFNRATQSKRQPGSAFKPFIYTAAFDKGLTPATRIVDSPISFTDRYTHTVWSPQNFDGKFMGPITMRTALVQSRNVVTVKILQQIGVDYAMAYAANMGITSPLVRNFTLALGSAGVTLLEMVRGYGVLANQGQKVTPYFISKIVDRTGHIFEEAAIRVEQVIDPRIAFLTSYIMQDVVESGTGRRVKSIGRPVAGKTGTTNDVRDAWFIGFSPSLVAGVWVGFDQEKSLGNTEVGGRAAAPIWLYFMESALRRMPVETFPVPEGIVFIKTDPHTGLPVKGASKDAIYESFIEGTSENAATIIDSGDDQDAMTDTTGKP